MSTLPVDLPPRTKWPLAVLFGIAGGLVVGIVLLVFLWPTTSASPRNLPVSVVGSDEDVEQYRTIFNDTAPGLIVFVDAADRAEAVSQIKTRESVGAIVLGDAAEVLIAPASSAASAIILGEVATRMEARAETAIQAAGGDSSTVAVPVTRVVSYSDDDPYGAGLASLTFPRLLAGVVGGLVVTLLVAGVVRRFVALAAFTVVAGLVLGWVTQAGMGIVQGPFLLNAAAFGLALLATASLIVGCSAIAGIAGAVFSIVLSIFIATPLSAAAMPWQFLAEPWGVIGQAMVPGAANTLLRSLSYFPDANMTLQWVVLAGWAVVGLALTVIGHFRGAAVIRVPAVTLESSIRDSARL